MEIHKFTDILGKVCESDIYEGRMVLLTRGTDRARLPHSLVDARMARYVIAWPVENRVLPIYDPYPTFTRALRLGFDQTANTPFSATAYTFYPNLSDTTFEIPSGTGCLLYDKGEFTVGSGEWVNNVAVLEGSELEVQYAAGADRGKLMLLNAGVPVAVCTAVTTHRNLRFRNYGLGAE